MEIKNIEIKKVNWSNGKWKGQDWVPPKVAITLLIEDPVSADIKSLIDFSNKPCSWHIEAQAQLGLVDEKTSEA